MSDSLIRDNYNKGNMGDFLREIIAQNSELSIVSAYFTIFAYHHLKKPLSTIKHLRFLFGEPTFIRSIDPEKVNSRDFKIEDESLSIPLANKLIQKATARECSEWIKEKVEIRSMVKPNFLHGKMYHIQQENGVNHAVAGSSNFTVNGLGLSENKNIELNMVIDSNRDLKEMLEWFNSIWNDATEVEDVKEEVLKYLDQLYTENEPEFIYFKTLYHIFEDYINEQKGIGLLDEKTGFYDSQIWNMLYPFQKDGVKGTINKILKHNGCIIADSVGLGKTFEALAVIKYFELMNGRVLVICPKKLRGNWTVYQSSQNHTLNPLKKDRFNYTLLYHTDMGRVTGISDANSIDLENFNWGAYNLVVIDESHNFRGNPVERKVNGQLRMNRAMWLMEKVIKSGSKTNVLMLSATPVNNTLKDIRNQINFITEGRDDALFESCKIGSISSTLENAQRNFTRWADKENPDRNMKNLLERLDSSFFKLLDELTIARSRNHVKKFYDSSKMGSFPKREKPISIYPTIDTENCFPSYDSLNQQIGGYKLSVFNPSAYVRKEKERKYEEMAQTEVLGFKQKDRENFLIGMMKVNFLKRLESSIESFEITLHRTIEKINKIVEKIQKYLLIQEKSQEEFLDSLIPDEEELPEIDEDEEGWKVGKKLKFDLADLHLDNWLKDLQSDKDALVTLYNNAKTITPERDAKLKELKILIEKKSQKSNKKVLVFTAFADTAQYLFDNLEKWCRELGLHIGLVTGSFSKATLGKNDYENILVNFSPQSKNRSSMTSCVQDEEIDILIATDCISEGQNLQDCDYLVNYDIHWNPVRIIQRFGRIDRLGSTNPSIQLVNFWVTAELDNYINLKARVEARMALVDVTATGEDNVLNVEQIKDLITEDMKYRNKQLKRLQEEVLDLEEMDETISLTDFTLDDFRVELINYIEGNRKRLKETPWGLYAVVPSPAGEYGQKIHGMEFSQSEKEIIRPGVIFCLSQKNAVDGNEAVNPLSPYFLVYVREDGTVRFNYTHAKHILEIYRKLCQGRKSPYTELCELFNEETQNGEKMETYTDLLKKAAQEITKIFDKRSNQRLLFDREATLIPKAGQLKGLSDFELVSWLIVR